MKKEGEIMAEIIERINEVSIPPHIAREIGLDKNWKKAISSEKVESIIRSANKYKEALRKLSKD